MEQMVQRSNALKVFVKIDQTVQFMHAYQIWSVLYLDACKHYRSYIYSRNKLDFWNVHGIMNSFGLLKVSIFGLHINFARDNKYS